MPFFSLLVISFLPKPKKFFFVVNEKGEKIPTVTITWPIYNKCQEKVIAWHFAELEKMDSNFRFKRDKVRFLAAKKQAEKEGICPKDRGYPDPYDFFEFSDAELQ